MIEARSSAIEMVASQLGQCLTREVARDIAGLRAHASLQDRIDSLAEKNSEGRITPEELEELEGYVSAATFLSVLQAEARRLLREQGAA